MKAWKTVVPTDDDEFIAVDTISYDGKDWLVPEWLPGPSPAIIKPARLIPMASLSYEELEPQPKRGRWARVGVAIPRSVLDGLPAWETGRFGVVERPDLFLRIEGYE
jgi:hypothetical protein